MSGLIATVLSVIISVANVCVAPEISIDFNAFPKKVNYVCGRNDYWSQYAITVEGLIIVLIFNGVLAYAYVKRYV